MSDPLFSPCRDWAEQLAVFPSKDLSFSDQEALADHLAFCPACRAVLNEYRKLDGRLDEALRVRRPLQVSAELLCVEDRNSGEEEHKVAPDRQGDAMARRQLVFQSRIQLSISSKISFAGRMFNTVAAILVIGIIISGFSLLIHPPSTVQTGALTLTPPTPTQVGPVYPVLSVSYAGTVFDSLNTHNPEHTALYLTRIQQHEGSISGNFQGLGLVGTFKGTVTPTGDIVFTVSVNWAGAPTLKFEGNFKIGGELTGNFQALNQQGQPTGEGGLWDASSTS